MARYKLAGGKPKASSNMPRAGLPCLIIVILIILLTMFLMYAVLKSS